MYYADRYYVGARESLSTEIFKTSNPIDACYEMVLKLHERKML